MRKKQFWALLLALAMLCSLALPAYAEDGEGAAASLESFETNGFPIGGFDPIPIVTDPPEDEIEGTIRIYESSIMESTFTDENFKQYIIDTFHPVESSGLMGTYYTLETDDIAVIDCSGREISSLAGIEKFTKLETLICAENNISSLDLSSNTLLTELNCSDNIISTLNVGSCTMLYALECSLNPLSSIDLSKNTALRYLYCVGNDNMTSLDITNCSALTNMIENYDREEFDDPDFGLLAGFCCEGAEMQFPASVRLVGYPTVRFDLNGSDSDPGDFPAISVKAGSSASFLADWDEPVRDGFVFTGWMLNDEPFDTSAAITQDITLKAGWDEPVTVVLDFNGGTVDGQERKEIITYAGKTLELDKLPTPVQSRKLFNGWQLDSKPYTPAPLTGDLTLTASWVPGYTLHFDRGNEHDDQKALDDITVLAEGTKTVSFAYMNYDTVLPPLLNDDKANGYQFIGWDTDPNAAIDAVQFPRWTPDSPDGLKGPYEVTLSEENPYVTLYAIYGRIPTITVYKNDGTDTVSNNRVFGRGAFYSRLWIGGGNLTRSGFDLLGYSTDPNATEPDAGLEKPDPNQTPNVYYYTTKDVDLYAVWGAKRYTLSFNSNGGFGSLPNSVSFTMEDKPEIALPSAEELNLTKEHRVFLGWTLNNRYEDVNYGKNPTGTVYTAGSVLPASALKAANQPLYALWQYEPIVVSLDLNGYTGSYGEGVSYPMYYNYGASKSVGNGAPTGRPRTPSAQPGPKPLPELPEDVQLSEDSNPFCCWMDVYAGDNDKVFYPLGIMANWNKGTSAILNNDRDTLLLAVWKYTFVYYYDADGAVSAADTITATYISDNQCSYNTLTVRAAEGREGYDFLGWATEQGGEVVYRPGETIDTLSDLTLYPIYRSVYYVENPTLGVAVEAPQAAIDAGKTLFCGYYYDEEYTQPVEAGTAGVTRAYAKFVNPNVLTVKLQVRNASLTGDANKHDLRLITSIPGLDYISSVGFDLEMPAFGLTILSEDFSSPLYTSIRSESDTVTVKGLYVNNDSVQLALLTAAGIPHSYWTTTNPKYYFTATPYYITIDGTKVTGTPRSFRCSIIGGELGFTDVS